MPPKKDAKKGATKELDPSIYIRKVTPQISRFYYVFYLIVILFCFELKPVELEEIPIDPSIFECLAGKIANVSDLFPVWDAASLCEEKWAEPLASGQKVHYPKGLGVTEEVTLLKYLNLEPVEVVVDPKAKKEAKKDPKKGAVEAPIVLTEVLVDEHGRKLPVLFRDIEPPQTSEAPEEAVPPQENTAFLGFDILRPFIRAYTEEQMAKIAQETALKESASAAAPTSASSNTSPRAEQPCVSEPEEEPLGDEVDPFLCSTYRLVQRYISTITTAHLNSLATGFEEDDSEQSKHVTWVYYYDMNIIYISSEFRILLYCCIFEFILFCVM